MSEELKIQHASRHYHYAYSRLVRNVITGDDLNFEQLNKAWNLQRARESTVLIVKVHNDTQVLIDTAENLRNGYAGNTPNVTCSSVTLVS